ncbi:RNA polymerase III subunit C25 [Komagataella phaffii CBS 7435]|uniref:DNA-directed RNA polymerase subunit n=2 Tax=Komagataella phaffii TaxID=460519 RepID=C4R8S2_KOMPG|nr:RNA polymerase III subunit C25, required for transcription initiation [Komagataella phaffii GS115]AOA65096.1 GQ67_05117T0 [Komagataella phaffii]CAH2450599.1 RNA polymerase III subunit C25 [Komagataella phaffii CBS 7435]AOA69813.1 GQ68_05099T0 [Komagataella phaffii GS115]CAY71997.1 RNA polymerase III subunit C25, required for transcription initiation [Komagataella phaffii GS115]CCA40401.1 RNA polymerase III subunit C25 [Komagataella phaffii CBS 7435]
MFQLSVISDLIRVPPHLFHLPTDKAVLSEINIKYANKVIPKLGLFVSVWDLIEIQDGLLKPGDGATFITVKFRGIIWKPFVGEVLTGWIKKNTPEGIKVTMEFFEDIFIPKSLLFENAVYSGDEDAWIWKPDDDTSLYLDENEKIYFRIEEEVFTDIKPKGPDNSMNVTEEKESEENKVPPYAIIASCQTEGMGCVSWWE